MQYIVYDENFKGNKTLLNKYPTLADARKEAVKRIKAKTGRGRMQIARLVPIRTDSYWGERTDTIGFVEAKNINQDPITLKLSYKFVYRPWASKNKSLTQYRVCPEIEINEKGQTIKKSLNPNVASAYNRKREDLPFGL